MAEETSAFFTEKVPPKPQQRSRLGSGTRSRPRTLAIRRQGRSPRCSARSAVATGVVGDAMGEVRAHILDAEPVDEKLAQFVDPGQQGGEVPAERLVSQLFDEPGVLVADHGHAGRGGNHDGLSVLIEADEALGLGKRFAAEACVGVHLPATGLFELEVEFDPQPLQQAHHRPACLRVKRVVIAGNKKRCAHKRNRFQRTATRIGIVFDRNTNCLLQYRFISLSSKDSNTEPNPEVIPDPIWRLLKLSKSRSAGVFAFFSPAVNLPRLVASKRIDCSRCFCLRMPGFPTVPLSGFSSILHCSRDIQIGGGGAGMLPVFAKHSQAASRRGSAPSLSEPAAYDGMNCQAYGEAATSGYLTGIL